MVATGSLRATMVVSLAHEPVVAVPVDDDGQAVLLCWLQAPSVAVSPRITYFLMVFVDQIVHKYERASATQVKRRVMQTGVKRFVRFWAARLISRDGWAER